MSNLINAEFYKLKKSLSYKLLLAALFAFEVIFVRNEMSNGIRWTGIVYTGAEWFRKMPTQAGLYVFFLWFFVAAYVAGEFSNRTFAAAFLCGFPRGRVIRAKTVAFLVGLLPMMLIHAVTGTVVWSIRFGFGMRFSLAVVLFVGQYLAYCGIGFLFFGSLSFLCAMLAGNRMLTVGLSLVVTQSLGILMANAAYIDNPAIRKVLMFNTVYQLNQLSGVFPVVHIPFVFSVVTSLVWVGLILFAAESVFKRRELK